MMNKKWIYWVLGIIYCSNTFANNSLDSLLNSLDQTIAQHQTYMLKRESRIRVLTEVSKHVTPFSIDQYNLNMQIYKEYKAYICDSAIAYLNKNIEVASQLKDHFRESESKLLLSYLLSSTGMYLESVDVLESVDRHHLSHSLLPEYYSCFDHVYGELGFYTKHKQSSYKYWKISSTYKDSLYTILNKTSEQYLVLRETYYKDNKLFKDAFRINNLRLAKLDLGEPQYALVAYHRSLIYKEVKQRNKEKYYLTLSALSDIQSAIKDHASLWTLAQLLYEDGDVERAYRYMRFSWNETKFYNARLRNWQSAEILSLIDKTYQTLIEKQNTRLQQSLIAITALFLLLMVALVYIYRQMKKLSVARNELQKVNGQLQSLNEELKQTNAMLKMTNIELSESNHIKEEYIARFLKLCSIYINRLDTYRRMVNKKLVAGQIADLLKITRSQEALDEELQELYASFDNAFLHIFPDFVNQFNELLHEDGQILPKKDELLNTELRIFALIRLGINDSSQIAEFLRYSVNTIYNYRAKVKNKARGSRENFEDLVKNIR